MLRFFGYVMCAGLLSLAWAAKPATPAKKAPVKKTGSKTAPKSGAKSRTTAKSASKSPSKSGPKNSTRRTTTASRTPARKTASWRSRQAAPTADRYKQIQEALAAKGYLSPEAATGSWGPNSVDALKRFQADQNIDGTGKINSLSLIALGLGPKRENLAAAKPPAPPPGQ
jgi:hypothetical protein